MRAMEGSSLLLGFSSALTTPQSGWSVAYTYGALPSTFPGSAAAITSEPNVAVFLRYSA